MMHKFFDWLGLPKKSVAGYALGISGRLTFGWLWTDNPVFGEIDERLGRSERERELLYFFSRKNIKAKRATLSLSDFKSAHEYI